jgi:hypothetical protein
MGIFQLAQAAGPVVELKGFGKVVCRSLTQRGHPLIDIGVSPRHHKSFRQ